MPGSSRFSVLQATKSWAGPGNEANITNDKQRIWTLRHHSEWQERVFAMERKYSSTVCKLTILKKCAGKLFGSKEL